ncbi:MAG: hypothetical protein AB1445_03490 [Bacillota bacterium]
MSYEKRLIAYMMAVVAVLVALAMVLLEQGGRVAMLLLVLGGILAVAINRYVRNRFVTALEAAAVRTDMTVVTGQDAPLHQRLRKDIRWRWDSDTREWKFEGSFPYLAGQYRGHLCTVRIPSGVDFDWQGPESTRVAVHHKSKPTGFTLYLRASVKELPQHRKQTLTGDAGFDREYVIVGRDEKEVAAVLTEPVRRAIAALGSTGIRGIELNPAGVSIYEPGKLCDVDRIVQALDTLTALTDALVEYQRGNARN